MLEVLQELDWSPLYISIKTGVVATIFSFFLGIFAARRVLKAGQKAKAVIDGILTLPMVLPPTVAGFFLLLLFSKRRPIGMFLDMQLNIQVVQSWLGCVIAATVIAFPLMYRNVRAGHKEQQTALLPIFQSTDHIGLCTGQLICNRIHRQAGLGAAGGQEQKEIDFDKIAIGFRHIFS